MKPGIYTDLSNTEYHGDHGSYSKSSLSDFSVYPYNLVYQRQHPKDKTAFNLGSAAHTAILEPDKWEQDVSVCPNSLLASNGAKSTKAYKEWAAAQPRDKSILTESERDRILKVRDSIHENPAHSVAREYLTGGLPEVSCFWEELFKGDEVDDDTGYHMMPNHTYDDPEECHKLIMKVRPDYLPANTVVADLKTTATPIDKDGFEKHAYNMKYHWSAALTLRGLTIATGKQHRVYLFVVVEIDNAHEVAVFRATEEFIALGRLEVMETMQRLAWCDKNNKWPGAPNKVQQVGLPGWAFKHLNQGLSQ